MKPKSQLIFNPGSVSDDQVVIILIRHGEPDIKYKKWYGSSEMYDHDKQYSESSVKPLEKLPFELILPIKKVYHSSLRRAEHTANLIFEDKHEFQSDSRFREFERGILKGLPFKLPLKFRKVTARIIWFLGVGPKNIESFQKAKIRARENANYLAEKAYKENVVALIAHGLHNRYVIKYLKQLGWTISYTSGFGYLGTQILTKKR